MLESLFNAVAVIRPATALKNDSSIGIFLGINQDFESTEHPRIRNFQGKLLYRSLVPVTLRGMLCDFFKTVSTKRGFTKEYSDFVSGQIFNKITLRLFAFKIKALYFLSQHLSLYHFWTSWNVMITILKTHSQVKMMKNAFSFILKVLSVLKIFKFLSSYFGHI